MRMSSPVFSRYPNIAPPRPKPLTHPPSKSYWQRERSDASELSYYGSVQACVLQNVFCAPPPSLIVLRLRFSSSAYLSVLQSRPPPRHRTRVYYSLQSYVIPKELWILPHALKTSGGSNKTNAMLAGLATVGKQRYHGAVVLLVTSVGKHLGRGHNSDVIRAFGLCYTLPKVKERS